MARHVVKGHPVHDDLETEALFEKYTVDEIREIEKKTRQDIEKKKEDLRQMVGERYRDLIEAADTITEMKRSTEKVTQSISKMQSLCQNLKQVCSRVSSTSSTSSKEPEAFTKSEQSQLYGMALNLKLLMDMPEKIWGGLDNGQYLLATQQYLLARHIYTAVQLDPQSSRISAHFPILARQWTTISHFRTTILQTCRNRLKDVNVTDQTVCECLCSVLLVEDYTTHQLFDEYLNMRLEAVKELFEAENADSSVRRQLCDVALLIVSTVQQIYSVFHQQQQSDKSQKESACMLMSVLNRVCSKDESGSILSADDLSSPSFRHLSKAIIDFRPKLKHSSSAIPEKVLIEKSQQYVNKCRIIVHDGLRSLLVYISNIKGLATVRDEIWELLRQDNRMAAWESVCTTVFGKSLSVWDELMRQMFLDRVKILLRESFDSTLTTTRSHISRVLTDLSKLDDRTLQCERDVQSYVWTEGANDIPTNMAWLPVNQKSLSDGGALIMKARAYTPAIQSLCRGVDQRLKILLDDVRHYVRTDPELTRTASEDSSQSAIPFDRYVEAADIQDYTQTVCEDCFGKLLEFLNQELSAARKELSESRLAVSTANISEQKNNVSSKKLDRKHLVNSKEQERLISQVAIDRVLLMGRFSGGICELSSNLLLCMSNQLGDEKSANNRNVKKISAASRNQSKSVDSPRWLGLREKLLGFRTTAYSVWTEYSSYHLLTEFNTHLLNCSGKALLLSCTQWDCIEIDEETEEGKHVKSNIRVPMQASWYVQIMLYNLCEDVNRIGAQAVHWSSIIELLKQMVDGILSAYERLLIDVKNNKSNMLTQSRSVQLLFDIKFLMNLLLHKDDSETSKKYQSRLKTIVDGLEAQVDPFDLDVFYPYIQNHLARQSTRSDVLYGSIVAEKHSVYGSGIQSSSAASQEQHNILPLSTSQNRFPLLPLSMQNRSAGLQPIVQSPKPKVSGAVHSNQPFSTSTALATSSSLSVGGSGLQNGGGQGGPPRVSSTSFLEQMSTMWFSTNR